MEQPFIRFARPEDGPSLLEIYAPYVTDSAVTFEYAVPSEEEFTRRVRDISAEYPYLVCGAGETILGYAYAHPLRERAAYRWSAELSVYLRRDRSLRGAGRALYAALIALLRLQNVRTVYGCVTAPNPESQRLHALFGFRDAGVWRSAGYKRGEWHDVLWFDREIGNRAVPPAPLLPAGSVDPAAADRILKDAADRLARGGWRSGCFSPDSLL